MSQVHARARTTPLIRTEIRESELGVVALAEHYNITRGTASKLTLGGVEGLGGLTKRQPLNCGELA